MTLPKRAHALRPGSFRASFLQTVPANRGLTIVVRIPRAGDESAGVTSRLAPLFEQEARMKKIYEKPTLTKREKLSRVTAGIPLSQQA